MSRWRLRAVPVAAIVGSLLAMAPTTTLDGWIVARYRGSQLLADSTAASPTLTRNGPRPRIDAVRAGRRVDTLLALHFSVAPSPPMLAVGSRATLAGPSGTIMPTAAQVLARRPFRTPRTPGAPSMPDSNWRHGWAYLVVVPHVEGRPPGRLRGWTVIETPAPTPRRRGVARP